MLVSMRDPNVKALVDLLKATQIDQLPHKDLLDLITFIQHLYYAPSMRLTIENYKFPLQALLCHTSKEGRSTRWNGIDFQLQFDQEINYEFFSQWITDATQGQVVRDATFHKKVYVDIGRYGRVLLPQSYCQSLEPEIVQHKAYWYWSAKVSLVSNLPKFVRVKQKKLR